MADEELREANGPWFVSDRSQKRSEETTRQWCERQAGYQYDDRYGREESRIGALRAACRLLQAEIADVQKALKQKLNS